MYEAMYISVIKGSFFKVISQKLYFYIHLNVYIRSFDALHRFSIFFYKKTVIGLHKYVPIPGLSVKSNRINRSHDKHIVLAE